MKTIYILILFSLLGLCSLSAQELTLEYNMGYGTYRMNELKDWLGEASPSLPSPIKNVKITDNYPGYITHQAKVGMEWRRLHQAGVLLDFMNTVGNKGVSDYSAVYSMSLRVKGVKLGGFYRFALPDFAKSVVRPYLQFSTGVVFNNGKVKEGITLTGHPESASSLSLGGANFFVEPAVGLKFRLHEKVALTVSAGYEFDLTKKFTTEESGQYVTISPDWSGLRLQGGIIYYIPLTSK